MTQPIIDVHTHLAPDLADGQKVHGVLVDRDGRLEIDGHRIALPGLYDAPRLAEFVRSNRMDAAWVSPPPPFYRAGLAPAETEEWVRALNDGMLARVSEEPALGALCYLPLDQPDVAHVIADGASADTAWIGWTASAGGSSVPLDDASMEPVWQLLEATGRPLLLHPGESPDARLEAHYLSNLLGNPVETAVAVAQLLLGGVLDRHPDLKVVLVHCAGVVPSLVGRWAQGVATERPGLRAGVTDPRVGVQSLWTDALAHSAAVVDLAIAVLGSDRLVLGSDYPFPMGLADPFESVAHLDPTLRDRIARNAGGLLSRSSS